MSEPKQQERAAVLADTIRRALRWEHLSNCDCSNTLRNKCRNRILQDALEQAEALAAQPAGEPPNEVPITKIPITHTVKCHISTTPPSAERCPKSVESSSPDGLIMLPCQLPYEHDGPCNPRRQGHSKLVVKDGKIVPSAEPTPTVDEVPFRTIGITISVEKYNAYHKQVVEAAVAMTDESMREFFDGCSYEEAFIVGRTPQEEAEGNVEALDE